MLRYPIMYERLKATTSTLLSLTQHVHTHVHANNSSGVSVAKVKDLPSRHVSVPSPGRLAQIPGSNRIRV